MEIITDIPSGWLIAAGIGFIFWAGAWYGKVNNRLNTVELAIKEIKSSIDRLSDKVDKLSGKFDELSGRLGKLSGRVDELSGRLGKISGRFDELSDRLGKLNKHFLGKNNPVHTEQSPIRLTEFGNKLRKAMEIKNLTEKYLPNIEISADDSEYQIQEHCFHYASNILPEEIDEQERKALEAVAYNTGAFMESLYGVLGVVFRDAKFKELSKTPARTTKRDSKKNVANG